MLQTPILSRPLLGRDSYPFHRRLRGFVLPDVYSRFAGRFVGDFVPAHCGKEQIAAAAAGERVLQRR